MTPTIGSRIAAETDTATAQSVRICVASIEAETESGWFVYGYRLTARGTRPGRATMVPRRYFVRKAA